MKSRQATPLAEHVQLLRERLDELAAEIRTGDTRWWPEYHEAARTLTAFLPLQEAEDRAAEGGLLTTGQLAQKFNVTPKTVLRRAKRDGIAPTFRHGKLLRWDPDALNTGRHSNGGR
ncbi:MAG: hypothetical protein Q8S13_07315 [Dehalococcoidia bacterium]|nr:hypothetical protein [Dehalococcoidia bacterium]